MTNGKPRMTIPEIVSRKGGDAIAMVTSYDAPTAALLDQAGVDILLVGDSLAMVVLGHENTLSVTVDEMLHHTRAVSRGRERALVIGDMPYMSYHVSEEIAVHNAGRFIQEGGADAVKLEGGAKRASLVRRLVDAEIAVMGHIGLTPQSYHVMGGFKVQGRELEGVRELVEDARRLEEAGVFAIVLEGVPLEVGKLITEAVQVPTIGIGAGPHCDGQVLVLHDLLGFGGVAPARFVRRYAEVGKEIVAAITSFIQDIRTGRFPADRESYHLSESAARELAESEE